MTHPSLQRSTILFSRMEHIIALSGSSPQIAEIDAEKFSTFMQRKPIWQFYSLTHDCYLQKTNQEKIHLINNYYKSMMEGKFCFFTFESAIT